MKRVTGRHGRRSWILQGGRRMERSGDSTRTEISGESVLMWNFRRDSEMRLDLSDEEAVCLLWSLEEALLVAEPEEEEALSSLISRLSSSLSGFSSALELRTYKLQRPLLPGESLPPLPPYSHSLSLPI
jgi:hypothetical protein